jgi:RHS repeat-associated protein
MLFSSDWGGPDNQAQQTHENVYLAGSLIATIDRAWPSNAVLATKYQHTDALGSPVAVTNASGQLIERMDYEPWGAIIGNPARSGMGYTGHVMDGATGLTYMQQRYYDQSIGRFLSMDPMAADTVNGWNFNRYNYAANNPYKFKDPDGRAIETGWDVANIVMGVASFTKNVASGNYAGAAVDAVGVVVDTAAAVTPGVPGGAGTAIRATRGAEKAREVLQANQAAGRAAEAATKARMGDRLGGEQVTFRTSDGSRTRVDHTTSDRTGAVETKSGNARLSAGQKKLQADVAAGRAVTPVGRNAEAAGFKPGEPVVLKTFEVERHRR